MRMVPVRSGLVSTSELVTERASRGDGALADTLSTVGPCRAALEESVPVLKVSLLAQLTREDD
jgi:hypothetical protein